MIYFIKTHQINEICYAIEADNLTEEQFLSYVNETHLSKLDFAIEYQDEKIEEFKTITKDEYVKIFDQIYPQFKTVNVQQKLYNIREFPSDVIIELEQGEERDQL